MKKNIDAIRRQIKSLHVDADYHGSVDEWSVRCCKDSILKLLDELEIECENVKKSVDNQ